MTTTTTPNRPNTHQMVVGHRVFRREFRLLPGLILAVRIGDTARARVLAEHCADVTNGLHRHHPSEDEVLWPRLLERTPLHAQLVHRMEAQHEQLGEHLERIDSLLPTWEHKGRAVERDELAHTFASAADVLAQHLDEEEREILPLVADHLTVDEWNELGQRAHAGLPRHKLLKLMGMVFEDATPQEQAQMLAGMPPVGRLMWRVVGRRQHRNLLRRLHGAGV